jgi:hypothetical protein
MVDIKTIPITQEIIEKLNQAIKISLEFEELTGKQLNITSIVGEIIVSEKFGLQLVVKDGNESFDAIDIDNKTVQIKTRRYKDVESSLTGPLLNKLFQVSFDYAYLVLLNRDYSFKEIFRIEAAAIQNHFDRINAKRILLDKEKRKTMAISQFRKLASIRGL